MQSELSILFFSLWTLVVVVFMYAAYWAFNIRRILVTPLYRREAFWVGAMALYFVSLGAFLVVALTLELGGLIVNLLGAVVLSIGVVLIFFWIDSTVRIARRTDPLFRDTLMWSKLRYLFWVATFGGAAGTFTTSISSSFVAATPFTGALLFGAIALLLSAKRSGDMTLRRHLRWTGLCILTEFIVGQSVQPVTDSLVDPYLAQSVVWPFVLIGAYFLYRSAKSLVPLSHLTVTSETANVARNRSL